AVTEVHAVVERGLAAPLRHGSRAHRGEASVQGLAGEGDLLARVRLDPVHVRALEQVAEQRDELGLLVRRARRPVARQGTPRDLVEVEQVSGEPANLAPTIGHGLTVELSV